MVLNDTNGKFQVLKAIPIGLTGDGQRPQHTNLIGRLIADNFTQGDLVRISMKDGSVRTVQLIGIDKGQGVESVLYVRLPPQFSEQVQIDLP